MNQHANSEVIKGGANRSFVTFLWAAGVLAILGLFLLGVSISMKSGEVRVVERIVEAPPKVYRVPTYVERALPKVTEIKARSLDDLLKEYGQGEGEMPQEPTARPLQRKPSNMGVGVRPQMSRIANQRFPMIRDTQVEKLVLDAKEFHLKGDVVKALTKLEEAELKDPAEPAVYYRRAKVYEDMRNWERAADAYEKIFDLGPSTGEYYRVATEKMTYGVQRTPDKIPLQLGVVREMVSDDGMSAKVTIPIRKKLREEIEPSQIEIRIFFYDIVDGKEVKPVPTQRQQSISKRWLTGEADWEQDEEEILEAHYWLTEQDQTQAHLFGSRTYFGEVVELYYKGELMDQYANPGRLHGIHAADQYKDRVHPGFYPDEQIPGMQDLPDIEEGLGGGLLPNPDRL